MGDDFVYDIQDQHSLRRFKLKTPMGFAVAALRFRQRVEGGTEVVTTTATINNLQARYLFRQL